MKKYDSTLIKFVRWSAKITEFLCSNCSGKLYEVNSLLKERNEVEHSIICLESNWNDSICLYNRLNSEYRDYREKFETNNKDLEYGESTDFIDTTEKIVKRDSKEYNRFREFVLKRDKVCQRCGGEEDLEVHHALPFKQYNSLGADPNNGIVLCKECHSEYHEVNGYKRNVNPVSLAQFLRTNPKIKTSDGLLNSSKIDGEELITDALVGYGCLPISGLKEICKLRGFDEECVEEEVMHLADKGLLKYKNGLIKTL